MEKELLERIDAYIEERWDAILADIAYLVEVPSVADYAAAEPGAPFGPAARRALDRALEIAARLGYETSDDEGYVGIADISGADPSRQLATIAHVDVVPAGPGWATDPYRMERREGWLLGRGVIDDKGPAVLSLYAGAYLLQQGARPRYSFRALLGSDEEVGMTDVHHYLATHDDPDFLFTPDADFPVCNAEKGMFGGAVVSAPIAEPCILGWNGSEAGNAIPGQSVLELALDAAELPAPRANAERLRIEAVAPGHARVSATGIGGHASMPRGTVNAVGLVVGYLQELLAERPGALAPEEREFVALLARLHADPYGHGAGIAATGEIFDPLTLNLGVVQVREGRISQSIDIRFPETTTAAAIEETLSELAAAHGAALECRLRKEPFVTSAESPEVRVLIDTYNEVTGRSAEPFSMGGGTYARNFKQAVSFGPEELDQVLPAWGGQMHGPNECAEEAQLKRSLKIYIIALLRLMEL